MVYKTWSYHFSKNWHFYAIIGVLIVGIGYLAHRVYKMNKLIDGRKRNRKRRDETRDAYSRHSKEDVDRDVEAGDFEVVDDAESLEDENLQDEKNSGGEEKHVEEKKLDERAERVESVEPAVDEKIEVVVEPLNDEKSDVPTCTAKISSGKRRGELCGRVALPDSNMCRMHS